MRRTTTQLQLGFTVVELLVVIMIITIMVGMATPVTMRAMAKGAVNESANAITRAWMDARTRAMQQTASPDGRHYGIAIVQQPGQRPWVGVILAKTDTLPSDLDTILIPGPDGKGRKVQLKGSVLLSGIINGAVVQPGEELVQIIYAQSRTGMPLDPVDVKNGATSSTQPAALGLESLTSAQAARLATVLKIGPRDAKVGSGLLQRVAIHQIGFATIEEL
jgi:prepilin-type N-terminal cleavage/methylation domain-containing protein